MSKNLTGPSPLSFGLKDFSDLIPERVQILGEDPADFLLFRESLTHSLMPATGHECLVAESIVDIEWELLQRRSMREAELRRGVQTAIKRAVVRSMRPDGDDDDELTTDVRKLVIEVIQTFAKGTGPDHDLDEQDDAFPAFDEEAAQRVGKDLADRAVSQNAEIRGAAIRELEELGLSPLEAMSVAYADGSSRAAIHDEKIQELERRRRDVKRDYDALQRARPSAAEIEEAEVIKE